ncbi:F-BAR domain only protein 1-like isoform 9-T9 [Salvelinus alpinus]
MAFFKNNFWGEKNAGFDVLYHNMKHGQIATKELAEFVRERAAIEETYSKSMSKLAKMASNGSPLGTFAPMWDLFRVSSDKLALCHLELMRKMNDLIRDINKYGDEQVKVHRKTKEEQVGTLEAVQAVQVQSGHLQKSREGYHAKCIELDRLRKEGAPQKELEKAEMKSKKAAESFAVCIEKYNRVGGDFEQKMSESAQKFQDIEEAHLRQMKQLIKGYSHSIEDTHVQVGQVHEEFKQNVENIGIDNLIQRFAEQKGTGKDKPALVGFEEYMTALVPEGSKKSRGKAFRIPGLGKRDKEPDSTDSAVTETPNSPLEVDEEGFVIRADVNQNGCSMEDKEDNFYSKLDPALWSCKHIPPEDPFLAAFERTVTQETLPPPDAWAPPRPRPSRDGRGIEVQGDSFSGSLSDSKTLPSSCSRKDRDRKRDRSAPPPESPDDPFAITMIGSPTHQSALAAATGILTHVVSSSRLTPNSNSLPLSHPKKELVHWNSVHNPFREGTSAGSLALGGVVREGGRKHRESRSESEPRRSGLPLTRHSGPQEDLCFSTDKDQNCLDLNTSQPPCNMGSHKGSKHSFRQDSAELLVTAPPRPARAKRSSGRLSGCERSRSVCSSPQPEPSPDLTSSSSSSPSEWVAQTRAPSPARGGQPSPLSHLHQDHAPLHMHLSRGPSPISLSTQELWPVAAAITEYINAYFKGGQHNRCLVKITGDLTMSFPAGITRIFTANPNAPVLSFRLVNISRVNHFLPNQKLLYSDPSQSDPDTRDFWFNMQALNLYLQREAELNPLASYYNVALLKYQVSSQDPGRAPLLLSAECQRSGTVTRVALDYHCCPATAPSTQLTAVQVLLPLDHTATDLQCQPPASWNAEERQLLWKLPNLSPTNHSKGSGTLCASWQCLEVPRGPPPSLAVQFVGSGASLSGMDVELVGSRYRMSLVKKRFATGKYMAGCSL